MWDFDLPNKLQAGKYYVPVKCESDGDNIWLEFRYSESLLAEIKVMEVARWHPERKCWSIKDSQRNRFQLAYLSGQNPYEWFDRPLVEFSYDRPLMAHQYLMSRFGMTRHYCILAAEQGTGKTLSAIEIMERSGFAGWLWVGPKSAIAAVNLEFKKWNCVVKPVMATYEEMKALVANWPEGKKAPRGIVFDESSRLKNPKAQRTQSAQHLADSVRNDWGEDGYVIEMSGTPAPKSPVDWFSQCEIVCPGFVREGNEAKFRNRLALVVQAQSIAGGMFPKLVTWWDDENKCAECGKYEKDHDFAFSIDGTSDVHKFRKSKNEIHFLYKRMTGLVQVQFKKDCLDLPEKNYRRIECVPTPDVLRAAGLIAASSPNTITALTLLRELSDGFQYDTIPKGVKTCSLCNGSKFTKKYVPIVSQEEADDAFNDLESYKRDEDGIILPEHEQLPHLYREEIGECTLCMGEGLIPNTIRIANHVHTPKDDAYRDILDSHDEDGRLVTYAGFQGSIDKLTALIKKMSWEVIRVDGRGWTSTIPGLRKPEEMLLSFQDKDRKFPKVVFLGQASSAGMGLTLTESCEIVYYSNDFNFESRAQSEDRIHRPGADFNRGVLITDLIHLPSDLKILDNLQNKRRLQDLSLGEVRQVLQTSDPLGPRLF